jgi:hypothetical protein
MRLPPALAVLVLLAAAPALAGTAAVSERAYEDKTIGFSIHPLVGWEPKAKKNPDDPLARNDAGGWYSKDRDWPKAECTVLRFGNFFGEEDRGVATSAAKPEKPLDPEKPGDPEAPEGEKKPEGPAPPRTAKEMFGAGFKSFEEWLGWNKKFMKQRGIDIDLTPTKAKFEEDEGFLWEGRIVAGPARVLLYGASVRRAGFEVAVIYEAPEGKDFVRDLKGAFKSSAKSLRILKPKDMAKAREALEKKLKGATGEEAFAERAIANLPKGWKHSRTANYVVLYDQSVDFTNPGLIARIGNQLEKIRAQVYEPLFPAARPITATSIVKVLQDPKAYAAYGAPDGSAGYWSWPSRELVFFCVPGSQKGVDITLDVLNHEAFHQYIFYAVGQVSPHSWFNEGHGDYFAGFNLDVQAGKFRAGKFHWRQEIIREAIERKTYVPLEKFLKFSQPEYYRRGGDRAKGENVGQNYAQGWSLVWFLRTTKDPRYAPILGRYFDTIKAAVGKWREEEDAAAAKEGRAPAEITPPLVDAAASEAALKAAFEGVDVPQLERDWIESKPW